MISKIGIKFDQRLKMIFVFCCFVFFSFFVTKPIFGQPNLNNGFVKKEILFLKWGNGEREIGLRKKSRYAIKKPLSKSGEKGTKEFDEATKLKYEAMGEKPQYVTTTSFGIDDKNNIYVLDSVNKRVLVFSKDGVVLRSVLCEQPAVDGMIVSPDGDIYFPKRIKNSDESYVTRVSEDNKRVDFKARFGKYVSGNTLFDSAGKSLLVMKDKKNSLDKKSQLNLLRGQDVNVNRTKNRISIKTSKINDYLQTFNKNINSSEVNLPLVLKAGLVTYGDVLGVNGFGDIFVWYGFYQKRYGLVEEDVYVYSSDGILKNKISINVNELDPDIPEPWFVKISNGGEIYNMWVSKNGVYLYKWEQDQ